MRALVQGDALYPGWVHKSFFQEGQFLNIGQVMSALKACQESSTDYPKMLQKYHAAWWNTPDMLHLYKDLPTMQFPVARLRHVTTEGRFRGIMQDGEIRGSDRTFLRADREWVLRVSCWGVHITPKRLRVYRKKRFAQFMQLATERGLTWNLSPEETAEVRDMLANSPAMREDSRYGNFQLSFTTKDLLAMYQEQHCGGQKPVLRVLGTEAYKQELVYWFLVHSPHWRNFDHLPKLRGPFSWDGNLLWTPESTTDKFLYHISNSALRKKPMAYWNGALNPTYDPWIWDNIVFAFNLPGKRAIRINPDWCLKNVQACETTSGLAACATNRFLRHPAGHYVTKERAQSLIHQMKRECRSNTREVTTQLERLLL